MKKIKSFIYGLTGISLLFVAILFISGFIGSIYMIWTMLKFINQ